MSEVYNSPSIADADWYDWLVIFNDCARGFIGEVGLDPPQTGDREAQSVKFAIAARALNLVGSALVLLKHGEQLAFRIMARSIIECAIHMDAACNTAGYLTLLLDDDKSSRISRGKLLQRTPTNLSVEANRKLQQFVMGDGTNPKSLNIDELAKKSEFPRLRLQYRQISADIGHVTWTSLCRHPQEELDRVSLVLDPPLEDFEMFDTVSLIALSGMTIMKQLRDSLNITQNEEEFSALGYRYIELYRKDVREFME